MSQTITGTWQLIDTQCIGANGETLPPPYGGSSGMGLLSLRADGRMVCVLCESAAEPAQGGTQEYNSYCGSYQYDGKELTTRVDAASNPDWIGSDQIRDVSFNGNILVLKPIKNSGPAGDGQRILHWVKFPEVIS